MEYLFVVKSTMIEQIEWGLQNEPITKNTVFPVATLFF